MMPPIPSARQALAQRFVRFADQEVAPTRRSTPARPWHRHDPELLTIAAHTGRLRALLLLAAVPPLAGWHQAYACAFSIQCDARRGHAAR